MTNSDDENGDYLIHDGTDDTVVSHPVLPEQTKLLAGKWLADGAGIIQRGDSFTQNLDNPALYNPIQAVEFVHGLGF